MREVGPDASGSNPGLACVHTPDKSGIEEPCGCPKTGVATAATNVASRRKFRRRVFMFSSLSWFASTFATMLYPARACLKGQRPRMGDEIAAADGAPRLS